MPTNTKRRNQTASVRRQRRLAKRRKALMIRGLVILAALFVVIGAVFLVKKCAGPSSKKEKIPVLAEGITFNGESLTGLTTEQAKVVIERQVRDLNWKLVLDVRGESVDLGVQTDSFLNTQKIDELLAEAMELSHPQETLEDTKEETTPVAKDYVFYHLYDKEATLKYAKYLANSFDKEAMPAVLSGYDKENDTLLFTDAVPAEYMDQTDFVLRIEDAIEQKHFQEVIPITFEAMTEELPEEYKIEAMQARYGLMEDGFITYTNPGDSGRDTNIRLACEAISGTIVAPGATFSTLEAIGGTTKEQGYQEAGTFVNGEVVKELGGGICQVSTTLYNAVIQAGLNTTERHNHSMTVSYVPSGEDAMISYPSSDFQFTNNSEGAILVTMGYSNNQVWAKLYGIRLLAEGESIRMESVVKEEIEPGEPKYVDDLNVEPGQEVMTMTPAKGYKVATYLIHEQNGTEVSREFLHNSNYKARIAVIHRNPNAPEETTVAETETQPEETTAAKEEATGTSQQASAAE